VAIDRVGHAPVSHGKCARLAIRYYGSPSAVASQDGSTIGRGRPRCQSRDRGCSIPKRRSRTWRHSQRIEARFESAVATLGSAYARSILVISEWQPICPKLQCHCSAAVSCVRRPTGQTQAQVQAIIGRGARRRSRSACADVARSWSHSLAGQVTAQCGRDRAGCVHTIRTSTPRAIADLRKELDRIQFDT